MKMLTAERLRQVLSYDPETGVFRRLVKTSNSAKMGQDAGIATHGYVKVTVDGRKYYGHRLAFMWMLGRWPVGETDHGDGNKANNAWANLREATQAQNNANRKKYRCNRSGFKGVYEARSKRWFAAVTVDGKQRYIGTFDSREDASAAYSAAAVEYFGEFARI